ncbi:MAG: 4-hydroxyphenylacetate 3-hydroxylase family protein [Desulfatiglandales bacterium]
MMNAEQYLESLRKLRLEVYMFGKRVDEVWENRMISPSTKAVGKTYELAHVDKYKELFVVKSHLTGSPINRFTHIHQSAEDLLKKTEMNRILGRETGCCFQRCVGLDALNAVSIVSYEIDQKYGTSYFERFLRYLAYVQDKDLVLDGAMTDPKGDRSLPPHGQEDPDMYLRVVEVREDGIVVRGAKAHQTGAVNSHEIIVMPTMSMKEGDKDYAICFALPSDARGVIFIVGRQASDTRKMESGEIDRGNVYYGGIESLIVFDDVFVPWERVFMFREYEYSGGLVERFAAYHRHSYSCKVGVGDVLIGAAALIAEYNGVDKAHHIREKIVEMNSLNETLFCGAIACAAKGHREASGTYIVDTLLANVHKQNVTRFPYEIARLAQDIAGGLMGTMPSEEDFRSEEVGHWIQKYLKGKSGVPTEERLRVLRLIESLTLGSAAVGYLVESMHGAGSPQAQRIMIQRAVNMEEKKESAKRLCGIVKEGER